MSTPTAHLTTQVFLQVIIAGFLLLNKVTAFPSDFSETDEVLVKTASLGSSVVLRCRSNDRNHNFIYWYFLNKGAVIGPANTYDDTKYKYEILSGNLTIRGISKHEEGLYQCVSRAVRGNDLNIKLVKMIVRDDGSWGGPNGEDYDFTVIKVLIVLIALVLIAAAAFFAYQAWPGKSRYTRYMEANNDDDDDSTEELFSAPSTSGQNSVLLPKKDIVQKKPQKESAFADVDISTDFKSILDTANDK